MVGAARPERVFPALGAVYGVVGPGEVRRHPQQRGGTGGDIDGIDRLSMWFRLSAGDVEVATALGHGPSPEQVIAMMVSWNVLRRRNRLRFPIRIVVDRREITIPVDGPPEEFVAYTCGNTATTVGRLGSETITIRSSVGGLRKLRLGQFTDEDIARFFDVDRMPARSATLRDMMAGIHERALRSRKTTPKAVLAALNGTVVGVSGCGSVRPDLLHPVAWDGASGSPKAVYLGWYVGRWDDVQITTSRSGTDVANIAGDLLRRRLHREAHSLRFPLDLSIARENVTIPIDGHPTRFTAYVCGDRVAANATFGEVQVLVGCPLRRLPTLTLATLTAHDIAERLKTTTYRTPWEETRPP